MVLYDYQQQLVDDVRSSMRGGHRSIIVQSPTGSGKTVIFAYLVKQMNAKGKRALILTNRIELLTETGGTLADFNLSVEEVVAGCKIPPTGNVCIAMAQTLRRRIDKWSDWFKTFDVVICDEIHLQDFNAFFEKEKLFGDAYVLGFTATPERTGSMRQLAQDFSKLILGLSVRELISRGRLVPDRYYGVDIDLSGVGIDRKTGDYNEAQMFSKFDRPQMYGGLIKSYVTNVNNTITIVFCCNIQHAIRTCEEFNLSGIPAKFIVSEVSKPVLNGDSEAEIERFNQKSAEYQYYIESYRKWSGNRDQILSEWKSGSFKVLVNASILTTGFNAPQIQTVVVNRATLSANLWLQMLGRGSRVFPGKSYFNILDFGGNGGRLGYYQSDRQYSLIHEQSRGGGSAPVKECGKQKRHGLRADKLTGYTISKNNKPGCGAYIGSSVMICPYCGYAYDTEKELIDAELKLIEYQNEKKRKEIPEYDSILAIEKTQKERGYKAGWLFRTIYLKHGDVGLENFAKMRGYNKAWAWRMSRQFSKT